MQTLEKRKLNLLVHLAKVDGRFEKSEQELLKLFVREKGLDESQLHDEEHPIKLSDFTHSGEKIELLHWALRLIQADKIIHDKEVLFCKNLASKLNFKPEIIDHYAHSSLPEYAAFEHEVKSFWLAGL